jgi:hypothetical protein
MSDKDDNSRRIKLEYSKEIEIALDDLQVFTECYRALLRYHRERKTEPNLTTVMDTQDKINQATLTLIEWLLAPLGYSTRLI